MNVLIVDDLYACVQDVIEGVDWEGMGVTQTFAAYSVAGAKEILSVQPIHLMLCDIEMPPSSGLELLRWARDESLDVECIFLSSHAEFEYARTAIAIGGFDYLLQPARYEEIEAAVRRAIGKIEEKQRVRDAVEFGRLWREKQKEIYEVPIVVREEEQYRHEEAEQDDVVNKVLQFIQLHIEKDLRRGDVADAVYMNDDYLSRIVKRTCGMSLGELITSEKICFACSLLSSTNIPVSLIASKVGYSNFSYFSQVFKKKTGQSPNEYRLSHRQ